MIGLRTLRGEVNVEDVRGSGPRGNGRSGPCGGSHDTPGATPPASLEQIFWQRRYDDSTVDDDVSWFRTVAQCTSTLESLDDEPPVLRWRAPGATPPRGDDLPPIRWRADD